MSNRTSNYIKAIGSSYITTIVITLIGFFLTPFVLGYVTREEYGFFLLAADIITWITLVDLGLAAVLNYKSAQLSAKPNSRKLNKMVSTILYTQILVSILFFIIGFIVSYNMGSFFEISDTLKETLFSFFIIFLLAGITKFISKIFSSVLISHQKANIDNYIKLFLVLVRTILTVTFLMKDFGLISLAYASLIANIFSLLFLLFATKKLLIKFNIKIKYFSINILKEYYLLGFWFFINGIAGIGIETFERILTAKYINIESVTTLVLTGRLYLLSIVLINILANSSRPMIGQIIGNKDFDKLFIILSSMIRLSTGFAIVLLMSIFVGNHIFVASWVGDMNYGGFYLEIAILFTILFKNWLLPYRVITSSALYKIKEISLIRILNLIIFIPLAILLVKYFGIVGILAASSIAILLSSFWYLPYLTAKYLKISYTSLIIQELKIVLPFLGFMLLVGGIFKVYLSIYFTGIFGAFLISSIMFIIGILLWWSFVIDDFGKKKIKNILKRK